MSKGLIGYLNQFERSALRAGSAVIGLDAANLADATIATPWQTAGVTTSWVEADAGAAVSWGVVGLFGGNLTAAATWAIKLGTAAGASDVYSSGVLAAGAAPGYRQAVLVLPALYSARFLHIDLVDPTNPDGFLRVGGAFAGGYFQPLHNFAFGQQETMSDETKISTTRGGQEYPTVGPMRRRQDFTLPALTEAEKYNAVLEIERVAGIRGNVLWIPNPASAYLNKQAIFGRIAVSSPVTRANLRYHSKAYTITERL